ncbi:uncharacterized protein LOC109710895 [Ananas comosus]|uniref:RING-type E3 ubiquitin transferase n=1 Tax=Ananas comosus TaxID=4615 RepID=A0A6P5F0D3_ANACO|nr:uncharacterized protein LOC109710895 [Ananas comosus]
MEIISLVSHLWALTFILSFASTTSSPVGPPKPMAEATADDPFMPHAYSRFPEVEKQCRQFLSSSAKIEFDVNRVNGFKPELSFSKGDWSQEPGDSALMPFDGSDALPKSTSLPDPLLLATFMLTHIDLTRHSPNALNVSGALAIAISRNGTFPEVGRYLAPEFHIWPGSSELRILFEGVYTESEKNGGESVVCLLGNALLPSRKDEWVRISGSKHLQPPVLKDDRILLILHYPKTFTLTSRAVIGEMRSLNGFSNPRYFDLVRLSSQLGAYSNYQFGAEKLISKACTPYPYEDDVAKGQLEVYKGAFFCGILNRFVSGEILNVVPNWNCNSTDDYCSKLGPFETNKEIRATDGGFANVGIIMQDVRCEPLIDQNNASSAKVSAVFRAVPPWENQYTAGQRSGLNGLSLSAEGMWNSSKGQLCMVGCLGLGDKECNSRICLYIPTFFSIKQRNIIFGTISSIKENTHFPLSFERPIHPSQLWTKFSASPLNQYKYSKIKLAGAFLERNEPFDFGSIIKKSLLSYPRKGDNSDELASLSNLADDLTLHVPAVGDPIPKNRTQWPFLQLEILSIGPLVGRYWAFQNASASKSTASASPKASSTERELLLNVSAELTLSGKNYTNGSLLYLEGLYNPINGKMYLIGCRDVRASWQILFESADLEDGLDCLIEVKVEYPPTTARWLISPSAKVSITSQRNDDDPLHFNSIELQTLPILYREQREDILSRRSVEGLLRIFTLSIAIFCIFSQLLYVKKNTNDVPYMSLVMLGVQALGYSVPLITGVEALFTRLTSESLDSQSYDLNKNQWYWIIDYLVKILILAAFLLTVRLGQKVWRSRIRLLTRSPLELWRVPNDKRVLLYSFGVHAVGFLIIIIVHFITNSYRPARQEMYIDSSGNSHKLREWGIELEEYIGLIQDFFLLPQIIGNFLWQIKCKPLKKSYYIGITVVRILPHVYDYIRAPIFNPYFSEEYEFVNPSLDFYSKFGDVAIPLVAVVFVVVVYVQQRWNYEKLSETLRSGQKKLLPMGSRVYERLPSLSSATFEAELVSGVNENEVHNNLRENRG